MNAKFIEIYEKYLDFKRGKITEGSYSSLEKLRDKIEKYEKAKRKPLYLSNMTLEWFEHFIVGMTNGKYGKCTNQTLKLYINLINSFLKHCEVFGYKVNKDYIKFKEYMKSYKVPKFDRPFLLDEELATLWKYEGFYRINGKFVPITPDKQKVRDLFVFQCQVGLRWSDIARLRKGDIVQRRGQYYISNFLTQKTKKRISVQLNQLAMIVIRRHCKRFDQLADKTFIFKGVSLCSNATHTLKWVAEKSKLDRLVEIQKGKLEKIKIKKKRIHEVIATHFARSKFATDWIIAGKDIYLLKIILGHSSIKTTERYIRTLIGWIPEGVETNMKQDTLELYGL